MRFSRRDRKVLDSYAAEMAGLGQAITAQLSFVIAGQPVLAERRARRGFRAKWRRNAPAAGRLAGTALRHFGSYGAGLWAAAPPPRSGEPKRSADGRQGGL